MIDRLVRQIRHAVRVLARAPVFTLTAVLSLAIGLGANATIFTIANALLLVPTHGVRDMDRLVDLGRTEHGSGFDTVAYPTYTDLRDHNDVFDGVYAIRFEPRAVSLTGPDGADRAFSQQVSANYFDVIGLQPALGQFFHGRDEQLGVPLRQTVVSYAFWQRRLAADPAVVGRDLVLNGDHFTIVGVAPQGHTGTTILAPDLWVPLTAYAQSMPTDRLLRSRESAWLVMGARLKPNVTIERARADVDAVAAAMASEYPDIYRDRGIAVARASRLPGELGGFAIPFIGVLAVVVGLVLLIACTNLAGIMLARAAARSREVAIRLALGASRAQIAAQFLTESLLVFAAGGIAALILSRVMTAVLVSFLPALPVPIAIDFALDGRVVAFAAGLALLTGVLTGLAPALQSTRATLVTDLKMDTAGAGRQRLRHGFIAAQMALCVVLLVSAALFLRAFNAATSVQPGFDIDPIDVVSLDLSLRGYSDARALEITERILDRLAVMPGVSRVAAAAVVPLAGNGLGLGGIRAVDGVPNGEGNLDWNVVTPEYFETIGLPIVRGRAFAASDRTSAPYVAIVNQTMAARLWPGRDPLGQRIEMGDFRPGREQIEHVLTVVGVARDAKYRWLGDQARSFLYVPMAQHPWQTPELFLRRAAGVDTGALTASVRGVLKDIDPNLPLLRAESMHDVADVGLLPQRLAASVAGSLGGVALLLAAIGLYGVTAFTVARRTREIGVRMALGASEPRIRRLIVGHALKLTAIGGTIGLAAALALTRLLSGLLFGVSTVDPLSFGGTVAALVAITVIASYVPARRAARVNPVTALRTN